MKLDVWLELDGLRCCRLHKTNRNSESESYHQEAGEVWVWMCQEGEGILKHDHQKIGLRPGMYAVCSLPNGGEWQWQASTGVCKFEIVTLSRTWLARRWQFSSSRPAQLHPMLKTWMAGKATLTHVGLLTRAGQDFVESLAKLSRDTPGVMLLAEARILDWLASQLYRARDKFSPPTIHHDGNWCQDPIRRALIILESRLGEPMDLEGLARESGLSPTHLSRLVKEKTGITLREHQRKMRISYACELLMDPRVSVTSAALEVGYNSLSHFSKAFREETGVQPRCWRLLNGG